MGQQLRRSSAASIAAVAAFCFIAGAGPAAAADPPGGAKLDHVGVRVADIDRSIKFYTEQLGFRLERRQDYTFSGRQAASKDADLTAAFVRLPGASAIELIQMRKPMPGAAATTGPGLFHLGIYMKDVRAEYKRLTAAGVKFTSEPRLRGATYTASLQDPDGTTLELIEETTVVPAR